MTHPSGIACASDKFYAKLVKTLAEKIYSFNLPPNLPEGFVMTVAKSFAAYLEDMISELGVWNAVRATYARRYGAPVPFFETTAEYYDDDINIEDLKVLVWQAFNRCGAEEGRTFSPFSQAVEAMAQAGFEILVEMFEKAPAATRISDFMDKVLRKGDYFEVRSLAVWLSVRNPLTAAPFIDGYIERQAFQYMDLTHGGSAEGSYNLSQAHYVATVSKAWLEYMGLTGYSTAQLLSRVARARGFESTADKLLTVRYEPPAVYLMEGVGKETVTFKNLAGEMFEVTKDSLQKKIRYKDVKSSYMALARYGDVYYVNGVSMFSGDMPKNIDKAEIAKSSRKILEVIDEAVKRNKGRRVFYCRTLEEISAVLGDNLVPIPEDEEDHDAHSNYVLLLSSTHGPLIVPDYCEVFKDPKNPFYSTSRSDAKGELAWSFICQFSFPDDVIEYIVDHKLLPSAFMGASQGKRFGKKIVQDNMDFLFHFNRVTTYSPAPGDV